MCGTKIMDLTFLTKNYELLGVTLSGAITLYFLFKDLYSKVKENKNDLEKFKQDQSKKCDDHRKDSHDRLEKVEKKIDDGFSNLENRIETLTNHLIEILRGK